MKKNFFELLLEINLADIKNGTENLLMGTTLVSAVKTKKGTQITMGVDKTPVIDLMNGDVIPIILIITKTELDKIKNQL